MERRKPAWFSDQSSTDGRPAGRPLARRTGVPHVTAEVLAAARFISFFAGKTYDNSVKVIYSVISYHGQITNNAVASSVQHRFNLARHSGYHTCLT